MGTFRMKCCRDLTSIESEERTTSIQQFTQRFVIVENAPQSSFVRFEGMNDRKHTEGRWKVSLVLSESDLFSQEHSNNAFHCTF